MAYINTETNEYPIFEGDLRLRFPLTSFPSPFSPPEGYVEVQETPQPEINWEEHFLQEGVPENIEGVWKQKWEIVNLSSEEILQKLEQKREKMVVSRFQAKSALYNFGIYDQVETLINSANTNPITKIAWYEANEFRRNSPAIIDIAQQLNLTEEQLDQLFIDASGIVA